MEKLIAALPERDIEMLKEYINEYGHMAKPVHENFLAHWAKAKKNLYSIFGEQFIISKEVTYARSSNELQADMNHNLINLPKSDDTVTIAIQNFHKEWVDFFASHQSDLEKINNVFASKFIKNLIGNATTLIYNSIGSPINIPAVLTVNNKELKIPGGTKPMRAIGKIVKACGFNYNNFEVYRNRHSQILNQRYLSGTLYLSIHPMDYITMSDNKSGWSSCMSWAKQYPGEYRSGTLEMMNSDSVIVAYLSSDNNAYYTKNYAWNDKQWRELIVLNEDIILGVKQYPYDNDNFESAALEWVRELAQAAGFSNYEDKIEDFINYCSIENFHNSGKSIGMAFNTNMMYNDVYDERRIIFAKDFLNYFGNTTYSYNFSGPAYCLECGDYLDFDDFEEDANSRVICSNCYKQSHCSQCGELINPEEAIKVNRGAAYLCQDCKESVVPCANCGEFYFDENIVLKELAYKSDSNEILEKGDNLVYIRFCPECCHCSEKNDKRPPFGGLAPRRIHYSWDHPGYSRRTMVYQYENFNEQERKNFYAQMSYMMDWEKEIVKKWIDIDDSECSE